MPLLTKGAFFIGENNVQEKYTGGINCREGIFSTS
jgi:hypothetical protein